MADFVEYKHEFGSKFVFFITQLLYAVKNGKYYIFTITDV